MPEGARPRLTAHALAARRGGRMVFDGVTLNVGPGDLIILRGANGVGKTTLLRTLSGLTAPSAGTLERSDGSTVFLGHADGVKGAMTALENIEFWIRLYDSTKANADAATAALQISPFMQQRVSTLSAGQRRRLALCRAVISDRPIWMLDEPTSGMDAKSVSTVTSLIEDHCRNGGIALIATHEQLDLAHTATLTLDALEAN